MIDNGIKKTLECCTAYGWFTCTCCQQKSLRLCKGINPKDVLNLVNQYEAEIERLQKYNTEVAFKHYNDGIKEFSERVKEETYHYYDSDIDKLAKEMRVQKNDK